MIVMYDHKFFIAKATGLIFVDMVRSLVNEKSFKSLSMLQTFLIVSDSGKYARAFVHGKAF